VAEEKDIIDEINVSQLRQLRDLLQLIDKHLAEPSDVNLRGLQAFARKLAEQGWQGNIKKIANGDVSVLTETAEEIRSIQERFKAKFSPLTPEREQEIRDHIAALEAGRAEAFRLRDEIWEGLAKVKTNAAHSRAGSPSGPAAAAKPASIPSMYIFRKTGDGWQLAFGDKQVVAKHLVGMYYLRELLSRHGQPITAVTLEANLAGRKDADRGGRSGAHLTTDELAILKDELAERRQAFEEANAASNDALSAEIESEIDALQARILSETGLGGRVRSDKDSEKSRVAVTNAIDRAITAITQMHPALGNHLIAFVSTGTICQYRPDQEIEWSV
jgi:hypothetical protein